MFRRTLIHVVCVAIVEDDYAMVTLSIAQNITEPRVCQTPRLYTKPDSKLLVSTPISHIVAPFSGAGRGGRGQPGWTIVEYRGISMIHGCVFY